MSGKSTGFRLLRASLWTMGSVIVILAGLWLFVYWIAVSDQERVPELLDEFFHEHTGGDVYISHYRINLRSTFPNLAIILEDVRLNAPKDPHFNEDLLRMDQLRISLRFWPLLQKKVMVRSVKINGGKVALFRNADGSYFNLDFLKAGKDTTTATPDTAKRHPVFSLDRLEVDNFTFFMVDSLREKHYHVELRQTDVRLNREPDRDNFIFVKGNWFFKGLTFKMRNGPFLAGKEAKIDWELFYNADGKRIEFRDVGVEVDRYTHQISGFLRFGQPAYLQLIIDQPGILMADAKEVIAPNIAHGLRNFDVDKKITAKVIIEGELIPGTPAPIDGYFRMLDATVTTPQAELTNTSLIAHFYNCNPYGAANPHSGCLEIDTFTTRVFDRFPIGGRVMLTDLNDPHMELHGWAEADMAALNDMLPAPKLQFATGQVELEFQHRGKPKFFFQRFRADSIPQITGTARVRNAGFTYRPNELNFRNVDGTLHFNTYNLYLQGLRGTLNGTPVRLSGKFPRLITFLIFPGGRFDTDLTIDIHTLDLDQFLPPSGQPAPKKVGATQKTDDKFKRISAAFDRLTQRFNGKLALRAKQLLVRGHKAKDVNLRTHFRYRCPEHENKSCFDLDTLTAVVYDRVPIAAEGALVDLTNPQLDMHLLVYGPLNPINKYLPADKIQVETGEIDIQLQYQGALDAYFGVGDMLEKANIGGQICLQNVDANYQSNQYQLRDWQADLRFDTNTLYLDDLQLRLNQNPLQLQGQIGNFIPFLLAGKNDLEITLAAHTPSFDFNRFALSAKDSLNQQSSPIPKAPKSTINNKFNEALKQLSADLRFTADTIHYIGLDAYDVYLDGKYRLHCSNSSQPVGCATIDTFSSNLFGNAPVNGRFSVENLNDPRFVAYAEMDLPLIDLNFLLPNHKYLFHEGQLGMTLQYAGQPHKSFNFEEKKINATFSGNAQIRDAAIDFIPKGLEFRDLMVDFQFDEHDLSIAHMETCLNQNPVQLRGQFDDFLPFLMGPEGPLQADLVFQSNYFNFDYLEPPAALERPPEDTTYQSNPIGQVIQKAVDQLDAQLDISMDVLHCNNFDARGVTGKIHINADTLDIHEARLQYGEGEFYLEGQLTELQRQQPSLRLETQCDSIDVAYLFWSFNNFGFQQVTFENIQGIMTADIQLRAKADSNYLIQSESVKAQVDLVMHDGRLINFPGISDIQGFLFKHRDLDDIQFATIENRFLVRDQEIVIDDLTIASSAIGFTVDGYFDISSSGNTNLLFEIPWINVFKLGGLSDKTLDHYKEKKHGPNILVQLANKDGVLEATPVLSRKKHREVGGRNR